MATLQQIQEAARLKREKWLTPAQAVEQVRTATSTANPPVTPPTPTATPPQTMQWVNGETFQVAPTNAQGISTPTQPTPQSVAPVQPVAPSTPAPTTNITPATTTIVPEVKTETVKPETIKTEAPIDFTQAKGREQDILKNLESFKSQNMTPEQIMKASGYAEATPEKKALIEPYLKTTQPTASGMFNAIMARQDIPDDQKTSTAFKIAQNRYTKANLYASMTPAQVSQAMTDTKLIEWSQAWEDLKLMNPKLVKDVENLRVVNGSTPNIFTYTNNPDGTPVKINNLEKQFAEDYLGDYGEFLKWLFTVQTPEQIRAIIYTPDVQQAQEKATEIELRMNEIEKNMDAVDDDVDKEMAWSGATASRIALEKASRKEKFQNQYNAELKNYTTYANKANNLITQNTAAYQSSQTQRTAMNNALALAWGKIFENKMALEQSQAEFDQKIAQQAQQMGTPELAIPSVINQYAEMGIMASKSAQQHIADAKAFIARGGTLGEYISQMQRDFQAKPEYKAKFAPKADNTPFQIANLWDWRALMYNQATGEYQQINASAVQTASQSPITIAQYSQSVRWKTNLQCGELVNDYWAQFTGSRAWMGDTLQSKINAITKIGQSTTPQVWGLFTLDTWTSTGHTGIVTWVNGNQITVLEANRSGNKNGEPPVEATYTISNKMRFSNPPSQPATAISQYNDQNIADLAYLVELQEKNPTQAAKDMKELGYTARDLANYKSGNVPLTEKQKNTSMDIIEAIRDLTDSSRYEWNDAVGKFDPKRLIWTQDAEDATIAINNLVAKLTLPNLGVLKWPMSDKDIQFIKEASTKLATTQSNKSFERNLIDAYNLAARRAWIQEIKTLDDIKKWGSSIQTSTNTGAGQISPQDLSELQKILNP